ncbi:MAG: SpoIIE family protein phosphatase [Clostridia bacterium]|nr:SpoIIE family protein phosphatase [Clostridia bacterium]
MKRREAGALRAEIGIEKTENGKTAAIVRPLLIAAIGAAVAGGRFLFGSAPFGAALICAVAGPLSAPAAFLGVSAGSFLSGDAAVAVPVFFSLLIGRLAISLILARDAAQGRRKDKNGAGRTRRERIAGSLMNASLVPYDESVYIRMALSSVASLAGGVLAAAVGGEGTAGFVSAAASSVIAPTLVWLVTSSRHWEKLCPGGGSGVRDAMLEEAGTTSLCAVVVLSFYAVRIPVVDLGVAAAFAVAVVSVRKNGLLRGLLRGFVCGAVISPHTAALIAFCAVVCGVATRFFDTGSVFLSAAAGVLWGYFESGLDVLSDTVPEMIVSVAVLTPAVAFGLIPRAPARRGAREVRRNGEQGGAGGPTEKKLIDLSRGLRAVSKELYSISDELTAPSADDVRAVCDEAFEEVCAGCGLSGACRGAERTDADRVKEEIAGQLLHGGRASASAVSRAMAKRCYNIDRIIDGVNEKFSKKLSEAKVWDRTPVVASDYEAVAEMLKDAARYDREEARADGKLSERLSSMLPEGGFYADGVAVYGKRRKRAVATGVRINKTSLGSEQIKDLFGQVCGIEFGEPSFSICGDEVNMELLPLPKIRAEYGGVSEAAGDPDAVCGDVIRTFETEDKRLYMLISDGEGRGKEAYLTARMCASFLETVLGSGAATETALKMLNSVIRARGTECSATVDLAEIDLLTGKARFIKSGAAPSFIVRDGRLFRLQSKTAPIGIIRALDAEMISFDVEPGDTVVMISDGVTRSFEEAPWLCELLSDAGIASADPEKSAQRIVGRAKEEGSRDDVTAGIVKIK